MSKVMRKCLRAVSLCWDIFSVSQLVAVFLTTVGHHAVHVCSLRLALLATC